MLKDYRTRVRGNYELMRAVFEVVNRDADELLRMNREADAATIAAPRDPAALVPLRLEATGRTEPFPFRGYRAAALAERGLGRAARRVLPGSPDLRHPAAERAARRPRGDGAGGLHRARPVDGGDRRAGRPRPGPAADPAVLVGRGRDLPLRDRLLERPSFRGADRGRAHRGAPAGDGRRLQPRGGERGSARPVPGRARDPGLPRRLGGGAHGPARGEGRRPLPRAGGPGLRVAWGFFNAIFEQKEGGEPYVLEVAGPRDDGQGAGPQGGVRGQGPADPAFAANPAARLDFFFRRSPWWDPNQDRYPVGRLRSLQGIPLEE